MEQIEQFLKANSFSVAIIFCFIFVVILFFSRRRTLKVTAKSKGYTYLLKRECSEFKKNDEAVLNNIIITFNTKKINTQMDINSLYENTINYGCNLVMQENFSFSNVGKI